MQARIVFYWITTVLVAFAFLSGGAAYLSRVPEVLKGFTELGYPTYVMAILGTFKLLGGIAILLPGLPRLKEWAYAVMTFNLLGAAWSHIAHGDPAAKAITPLVILAIALASWALRPASRKLGAASVEPASATTSVPEFANA
jgi:uncharacterized membrane protein YphA (DoxX/SURF4 family)